MQIKQTYKLYTLAEPTVTRPVQDPLAVTRLENQLYIARLLLGFFALSQLVVILLCQVFYALF